MLIEIHHKIEYPVSIAVTEPKILVVMIPQFAASFDTTLTIQFLFDLGQN